VFPSTVVRTDSVRHSFFLALPAVALFLGCGRTEQPVRPEPLLPADPSAPSAEAVHEPVLIRVQPEGNVEIRDVPAFDTWEPVGSHGYLRQSLQAAARKTGRPVILFAEPATRWQHLAPLFGTLRSLQFPGVTLALAEDRQLTIPFPDTDTVEKAFAAGNVLTVQVTHDGNVIFDHRPPTPADGIDAAAVTEAARRVPRPLVLLCIDEKAPFEDAVRLFALCDAHNFRNVLIRPRHSCGALAAALPARTRTPSAALPPLRSSVAEMGAMLARLKASRKARALHALQSITVTGKILQDGEYDKQGVELLRKISTGTDNRAPYVDLHSAGVNQLHNRAAVLYLTAADIYNEVRAIEHFRSNRGSIPCAFQLSDKTTPMHSPRKGQLARDLAPDIDTMLRDMRRLVQLNADRLIEESEIPSQLRNMMLPQPAGADILKHRPFAFPGLSVPATNTTLQWMYLDEWYIVGPFPNANRSNIDTVFPPEHGVDLGAKYIGMNGNPIGWRYVHSNVLPVRQPIQAQWAIWYAWTELHSTRERDVWLCIGCNDFGKLWVNGEHLVSTGITPVSDYTFDRTYTKARLKAGQNPVLFRIENAWGGTAFSLIVYCGAVADR